MGSNFNDFVYLMSPEYHTDDGIAIQTDLEFGRQNHGSNSWKISQALFLDIKRGDGLDSNPIASEGTVRVYMSDNGAKTYGVPIEIGLGKRGDYSLPVAIRPMGRYQSRKLKIVIGDACDFVLNGIEEEVYDTGRL